MSNNKYQNSIASLDFNKLRKLMDELAKLQEIEDINSLEADYSFDWQEDNNEMVNIINTLVNKTLDSLKKEDYLNAYYTLTFLKIYFQNFNSTINGITNDLILFYGDNKDFIWPEIPEDYNPSN